MKPKHRKHQRVIYTHTPQSLARFRAALHNVNANTSVCKH